MVDVCRRVDIDTLINSETWGYNEFHSTLLRHSDQVRFLLLLALVTTTKQEFLYFFLYFSPGESNGKNGCKRKNWFLYG